MEVEPRDAADHKDAQAEVSEQQDWEAGGRVHNWRNHVGHYTRQIWESLTHEQRVAIAMDAMSDATNEEWE